MEADNSQDFNERLSQWIASQGFWFQLRHAMSGGGGWSLAVFQLLSMGFKVLVVLAIVGAGALYFMVKQIESADFKDRLRDKLVAGLNGSEAEMTGFSRGGGKALIRRLGVAGDSGSFFQSLEAGNITFNMGFLNAFDRGWSAGVADANWLDIEIKPGANSEDDAAAAAETLFVDSDDFSLRGVTAGDARISWGYSQRTYGEIKRSQMSARRVDGGWRMTFVGGFFTQNWIRDFEIERLVVFCGPGGVKFESGSLIAGEGTVTFKDVAVTGAEMPELSGLLLFEQIPLAKVLPDVFHPLVFGTISGQIELGGSTNSPEGVSMDVEVTLGERDMISVRDRIHVLEALDVVDVFHNYKRIDFDRGGFQLESSAGRAEFEAIELEARELLTLTGSFSVERPEGDDLMRTFGTDGRPLDMPAMFGSGAADRQASDDNFTLKRAAIAAREEDGDAAEPTKTEETQFFADIAETRKLRREAAERQRRSFDFDGAVILSIPDDSFQRSSRLVERYPVDPETGKIAFEIPLEGEFSGLTVGQAEEILLLHSERD